MNRLCAAVLLLTLLAGASCGPDEKGRAKSPVPPTPAAPGTYVHRGSGIQLPQSVPGFSRMRIVPYNPEGTDIGVGYRLEQGPRAVVTVYIYPRPVGRRGRARPFEEHFALELEEVRKGRPDIQEKASGVSRGTLGGKAVEGRAVEFEFSGGLDFGGARVRSIITVFALPAWLVKYRVTAPVGKRDETLWAVERLLTALGFPPLGVQARLGPVRGK